MKQYWRTHNPIPIFELFTDVSDKTNIPNHIFVMTRNGRIFDRLPYTNWYQGGCNANMVVVAYCYKINI